MAEKYSVLQNHYLRIFRHMKWADISILNLLEKENIKEGKVVELISHIIIAESTWYKRIVNEHYENQFWFVLPLAECKRIVEETQAKFVDFILKNSDGDFQKRIFYKNSRGIEYTTSLEDIFTHIALHGTYHRGQIMLLMRDSGHNVTATDYAMFIRDEEEKEQPQGRTS
jgi:uncharacterized damage-inducible protein DinB